MLMASAMQQYHFSITDSSSSSNRSNIYYSSMIWLLKKRYINNYIYSPVLSIANSNNSTKAHHLSFLPAFFWTMEGMKRSEGTKYDCLLFDLDDTLYPINIDFNMACRKNIQEFMIHHLGINESEVPIMCFELYKEFGTTMAGLKAIGYDFDDDEYHAYAHGKLPYEVLKPDPILRNLLLSMPQRKIIFTNADKEHAAKVLHRLGLEDCFEGIICFETLNPSVEPNYDDSGENDYNSPMESIDEECSSNKQQKVLCKPSVLAMEAVIQIANLDPKKTLFFDDNVRNIASAKSAGLCTVIVGSSELVPGADYALSSIHNIKEAVPHIWEDVERGHQEQIIQSTVETVVLA